MNFNAERETGGLAHGFEPWKVWGFGVPEYLPIHYWKNKTLIDE
jgi:hypothetical protein